MATLEVTKPSSATMLGWDPRRLSNAISRIMNLAASDVAFFCGSPGPTAATPSTLTFFNATTRLLSRSIALYTLLYVPDPIWQNIHKR